MERLTQIEKLCAKHNLQCGYDIFAEDSDALYVNLAGLTDTETLKSFVAELPGTNNISYVFTGDVVEQEDW